MCPKSGQRYNFAEADTQKVHVSRSVYMPSLVRHTHDFIELVCITEGNGYHVYDSHEFLTKKGDIFLIEYGGCHTYRALSRNFSWINCIFQPEHIPWAYQAPSGLETLRAIARANGWKDTVLQKELLLQNLVPPGEDLVPVFTDMLHEYRKGDPCAVLTSYLYIVLSKITGSLCRKYSNTLLPEGTGYESEEDAGYFYDEKSDMEQSSLSPIMQKALDLLHSNLQNPVNAKELAGYFRMTQSRFSQLFRQEMGCTFPQYMIRVRMQNAGYLLRESDVNINEIVRLIGYTDPKTFYQNFHKYYGCTPTEYRKKQGEM